jgi:superfamily II DNA or RNA helicase
MSFSLDFSPARRVKTPYGIRRVQSAAPTTAFWIAWKKSSDSLKDLGYSVTKNSDGHFVVTRIVDDEEGKPVPETVAYEIQDKRRLLPYQAPIAGLACAAIHKFGSAIDASDAGTGKTYTALAVAREMNLSPAIICPKTQKEAWRRVCKYFGITPYFIESWEAAKEKKFPHTQLVHGLKNVSETWEYKEKGDVNYREEALYRNMLPKIKHKPISFRVTGRIFENGYTIFTCVYVHQKKTVVDIAWTCAGKKVLLIFDEVHKAKGKTQAAMLVIATVTQKLPFLGLSATIAANPMEMRALGYRLGLHKLADFKEWIISHGCYQGAFRQWECPDAKEAMMKIHHELFPMHGGRVRIEDLGDAFPETQITADLYEIEGADEQNRAYEKLMKEIALLQEARARNAQAAVLTLNLRYRQLSELLKVPLLTALALDGRENGLSVIIFVNFMETLGRLCEALGTTCCIHGQQSEEERQYAIDAFQGNRAGTIVANIQAGGVGVSLHDLHGGHPRLSLICPTYSATLLKQALGRPHRAGGLSKSLQRLIYAKGTIEEKVCESVAVKLAAISALNDGDLYEPDLLKLKMGVAE